MKTLTFQIIEGVDKGRIYRDLPIPVTIGREEGNLLRLNDERVSRFHAKVQQEDGDVILTDLESTNGTRVNGSPIQIRRLRPGDQVNVGRSMLLFGTMEEIAARKTAERPAAKVAEGGLSPVPCPATIWASICTPCLQRTAPIARPTITPVVKRTPRRCRKSSRPRSPHVWLKSSTSFIAAWRWQPRTFKPTKTARKCGSASQNGKPSRPRKCSSLVTCGPLLIRIMRRIGRRQLRIANYRIKLITRPTTRDEFVGRSVCHPKS